MGVFSPGPHFSRAFRNLATTAGRCSAIRASGVRRQAGSYRCDAGKGMAGHGREPDHDAIRGVPEPWEGRPIQSSMVFDVETAARFPARLPPSGRTRQE